MQADVKGTVMPILEIVLAQGEQIVSAHGELAWMSPGVQMSQQTGMGGAGGFMQGLKRAVGGGGIFVTSYQGPGLVVFAAKVPGHILPVDISPGQAYLVHRHGWLCGTPGVVAGLGMQQNFRSAVFGRDGFVLQKLEGQGRAWIELSGELTVYDLPPGQSLLVHPGHVGMFQSSVQFTMTRIPGIANKLFGGDGFSLVSLTGPGRVWLQSMPLSVLAHSLKEYLQVQEAGPVAGGAMLRGMFGG